MHVYFFFCSMPLFVARNSISKVKVKPNSKLFYIIKCGGMVLLKVSL